MLYHVGRSGFAAALLLSSRAPTPSSIDLLLLFDFSKAFDTISPSKLLSKLRDIGFSRTALLWIKSYLQSRTQCVISKGQGDSEWLSINLGFPQGSVLGLLLFNLYVSDLKDTLDWRIFKHIIYEDDLQIYVEVTKDDVLEDIARLSDAARVVSNWAQDISIRLNTGKTKAIMFGLAKNINMLLKAGLPGVGLEDGVLIPFEDRDVSLGTMYRAASTQSVVECSTYDSRVAGSNPPFI